MSVRAVSPLRFSDSRRPNTPGGSPVPGAALALGARPSTRVGTPSSPPAPGALLLPDDVAVPGWRWDAFRSPAPRPRTTTSAAGASPVAKRGGDYAEREETLSAIDAFESRIAPSISSALLYSHKQTSTTARSPQIAAAAAVSTPTSGGRPPSILRRPQTASPVKLPVLPSTTAAAATAQAEAAAYAANGFLPTRHGLRSWFPTAPF